MTAAHVLLIAIIAACLITMAIDAVALIRDRKSARPFRGRAHYLDRTNTARKE